MKKLILLFFLVLVQFALPQQNSVLYLTGSNNDVSINPAFSPDGNKIAFTKDGYKGIWIYDLATKSLKQITDEPAAGFGYQWSSDSKSILSRVAKFENTKRMNAVKIFDIESNQPVQLTDYQSRMPYLPVWSDGDTKVILPDKTGVEVFNSGKLQKSSSLNSEIDAYTIYNKIVSRDAVTQNEKILETNFSGEILNLVASPDRKKVAFEVLGGNLYSMNIDGTNLTDLGKGNRPRWSSDSKKIVYMIAEDDGNNFMASDIYTINSDGTMKQNITNTNDRIEMDPCFSPDGKAIVFDVYNDGSIYLMNIE